MTEYRNIGKLVACFGVKGELILKHGLGKKTSLKGLDVIFIEVRSDSLLPYFPVSIRIKSADEIYILLEGINSREEAQTLLQKKVWLTEDAYLKYASVSSPGSLVGFQVIENGEVLGQIQEIIEQPQQLLCRIEWKGKEAFIPLHEATIRKIDRKKKQVLVNLPDGLLDIFA